MIFYDIYFFLLKFFNIEKKFLEDSNFKGKLII